MQLEEIHRFKEHRQDDANGCQDRNRSREQQQGQNTLFNHIARAEFLVRADIGKRSPCKRHKQHYSPALLSSRLKT